MKILISFGLVRDIFKALEELLYAYSRSFYRFQLSLMWAKNWTIWCSIPSKEKRFYFLSIEFVPPLSPTQHPIQWAPAALSPVIKWSVLEADHYVRDKKKELICNSTPSICLKVMLKDNFIFMFCRLNSLPVIWSTLTSVWQFCYKIVDIWHVHFFFLRLTLVKL